MFYESQKTKIFWTDYKWNFDYAEGCGSKSTSTFSVPNASGPAMSPGTGYRIFCYPWSSRHFRPYRVKRLPKAFGDPGLHMDSGICLFRMNHLSDCMWKLSTNTHIRSIHCREWLSPLHGDPLSINGFFHRARNSLHPLFLLRQHPTENCILWGLNQHFGQSISCWAGPRLRRVSEWVRRHVISLVFWTSGFPEIFEGVYFKMMILIIVKQFETWTNDSI